MFDLPSNVTSVVEILPIVSDITNGVFGVAVVLGIAFVSLMVTSAFRIQQSFIASAFLTFIVSFFLYYLNVISQYVLFLSISYLAIALGLGFVSKGGGA